MIHSVKNVPLALDAYSRNESLEFCLSIIGILYTLLSINSDELNSIAFTSTLSRLGWIRAVYLLLDNSPIGLHGIILFLSYLSYLRKACVRITSYMFIVTSLLSRFVPNKPEVSSTLRFYQKMKGMNLMLPAHF